MNHHPQTIQIFLPTGDPQGIRIAEITTRIVRLIEVPRSRLAEFLKMPEAQQVGVYFLVGGSEDGDLPQLYIGQSGSLPMRLAQHDRQREFWNRALVAVSQTNSLTNTHAAYLEWESIRQAQQAERYLLENGNSGGRPHTPAPLQADCTEIHQTIRILMATLGHPVFEPLAKPAASAEPQVTWYCRASEADGRGLYTEEGFVVLKGSTGRAEAVPSFEKHGYNRVRERLLEQGVLSRQDGRIRFERDHLFSSPSGAAACLTGRTANGMVEWKDAGGQTLGQRMASMEGIAEGEAGSSC